MALLTSPNVQRVDSLIAEELDTYVDREHQSVSAKMVQQELVEASLTCNDVLAILTEKADDVLKLAVALLRDESLSQQGADISGLVEGCSITYAIYLYHAQGAIMEELIEYLRRRQIPRASLFAARVFALYGEIKKKSNGRKLPDKNEFS
ncbi:hypothetical protein [Symmachiella dynata]|uniref:hypothetical protein n=1 Tax=Symmachiella dynata TaxID=2527995 RepID=UPI0030EF585C